MTLKVIGAGFGRTGTLSLKYALEELGFGPCYHMREVIGRRHAKFWYQVAKGERQDLATALAGYGSTVDWPTSAYYQEQLELYPDAKVVLTVRDPERWYQSCLNTIFAVTENYPPVLSMLLSPLRYMRRMTMALIWDGIFAGRFEEKAYAIKVFNEHVEAVKQNVPADKLLVYEVKQGWEPLCEFLDVPVPDKPFPRVNSSAEFQQGMKLMRQSARVVFGAMTIGIVGWLIGKQRRQDRG